MSKLCECHGEPLLWRPDRLRKAGGTWLCRVKTAERQARYSNSEKGQARVRRYRANGGQEALKLAQRAYVQTPKGRLSEARKVWARREKRNARDRALIGDLVKQLQEV